MVSEKKDEPKTYQDPDKVPRDVIWWMEEDLNTRTMTKTELMNFFWGMDNLKMGLWWVRLKFARGKWEKSLFRFVSEHWEENREAGEEV